MTGKMRRAVLIIVLIVLAAAMLPGCGEPTPTETPNEPEYANAIAEILLQALINTENYTAFKEHFDEATQKTMTEASFAQTHSQMINSYGQYISKEFTGTREKVQDIYTEVSYKGIFEKRPDGITIRIIFQEINNKAFVSGIFFQET